MAPPKSITSRRVNRYPLPTRSSKDPPAEQYPISSSGRNSGRTSARPRVIRTMPKTVSTGTIATEASSSTASTNFDPSCPVTGISSDLFAHYRVMTGVLGSGKYGQVRECFARSSGQSFAVKSIDKSKVGHVDHLKQEIVSLSSVNHRNIIKMIYCFEDPTYLHIVTEKCTGGELFEKIIENRSTTGCFPEQQAVRIIRSLLEAVGYLHSKDLVHRDLKPENIIFSHDGDDADIKLIDFGLSRIHRQSDAPMSNPVGTSYYMSPECLARNYDKSCDVWSIGVCAYILLCGYPPFNGNNDAKIQESILNGKLRFSGKGWGDKSTTAKHFISCLLRKDSARLTIQQALNHPWIVKNEIL